MNLQKYNSLSQLFDPVIIFKSLSYALDSVYYYKGPKESLVSCNYPFNQQKCSFSINNNLKVSFSEPTNLDSMDRKYRMHACMFYKNPIHLPIILLLSIQKLNNYYRWSLSNKHITLALCRVHYIYTSTAIKMEAIRLYLLL